MKKITNKIQILKLGFLTALMMLMASVGFATNVHLHLIDHNGVAITDLSGLGNYNNGSWHTALATDGSGNVDISGLTPGSYYFNMKYNGYTQQVGPISISGSDWDVNFQTTLVKLHLMDHNSAAIGDGSGTGGYNTGAWHNLGATDGSGICQIELLPGSGYFFNMNYHNYTQQIGSTSVTTSGPNSVQDVNFQTTLVKLHLMDHNSAAIGDGSGTGGYNTGAWHNLGATDGSGICQIELLPGSGYFFNMNYHNYTQQIGSTSVTTSGPNSVQDVNFQTTLVKLHLMDHNSAAIGDGSGTGGYNTGAWHNLGATDGSGICQIELLPGSGYFFNMNYHNYTQQIGSTSVTTSGPNSVQNVNFQTTLVKLHLMDHNSAAIGDGSGTGGYNTGAWHNLGATDGSGICQIELLPGSGYYFNMNYHNYTQQIGSTSVTTSGPNSVQDVNFQTTLVSLNLKDCSGPSPVVINTSEATARYNTGSWYALGNTASGIAKIELLPGAGYYFDMNYNYGVQQKGSMSVTTGGTFTQNVDFNTTKVTFSNPDDHVINYNQGTWHTFTPGSMNLLPGNYYFQVNGGGANLRAVSGCSQNYYVAPCGTLNIAVLAALGCGGGSPLSAPAGGKAYAWTGPGGFSAATQTIIPNATGLYSVNVTYDFTCSGAAGGTTGYSYTVSGPVSDPRTVTIRLQDSKGNGIPGQQVQYYNGSWLPMGSTNGDGFACMTFLTPTFTAGFSTYFRVLYEGGTQQWSGVAVASNPVLIATTTNVYLNLKDHDGNLMTTGDSGTPGFYNGTWSALASTGSNGYVTKELLPGSYYVNMNYHFYTQQQTVSVGSGPNQGVDFQTVYVTESLMDHSGTGLATGTAGYYSGGWHYLTGSTDGSGTNLKVELLPGSYYFNMNYNHFTQQSAATTIAAGPATQCVPFKTTLVTTSLKDHNGNGLAGGSASYYSGAWYPITPVGTTDATGTNVTVELLPGSYYFNMNYNHYTQQSAATTIGAGPTQCVPFQTTTVTVSLKDCSNSPSVIINTSNAIAKYYSGGWYTFGSITGNTTAGTATMELLPGSYYFNMAYNNGTEQLGTLPVSGSTYPVDFNTTKVTFSNPLSSPISYYQSGWNTFTPNSMNLLPGSYYFKVTASGATIPKVVTGCSQNFAIAPCGPLAITLAFDGGCGGSPLSAPAGGSAYAWSGPGGFSATTQTIEPTITGIYNVNVTYDFTCTGAAGGTTTYSYDASAWTPTPRTVTIRLQDSKGNGIAGGTVQYYNGSWTTFGTGTTNSDGFACMTFPTPTFATGFAPYFRVMYAGGTQQWNPTAVSSNPLLIAQTTCTTVRLVNSSNSLISTPTDAGTAVQYYSGTWMNVGVGGTTGSTGTTSVELLPGSYPFHLTYAHANEQLPASVTIGAGPNQAVDFNTTAVTASLKANGGTGAGISGGAAEYYSGAWYSIGTTDGTGVTPSVELLPVSYPFHITYNYATYQTPASVPVTGASTNVPFTTTTVTSSLKANGGAGSGLSGGVAEFYSSASWHSVGTTDGSGTTTTSTEMLPGSYPFHISYNYATYQTPISVAISGGAQNVPFTTTTVTASLKANGGAGAGLSGGVAEFYSSASWHSVGTTDGSGTTTTSTEMLPGSYPFHISYNYATYQKPASVAISGAGQNVDFATSTVTVSFMDHTGSGPISGGAAQFYSGTWHDVGTGVTDGSGTAVGELLPGSYPFHMTYNFGTYQPASVSVSGAATSVPFQTAGVVIHFQGSTAIAHSGATIGYYSGGWHTMADLTGADGNSTLMEMLPVPYYYNATLTGFGTTQVGPFTDAVAADGTAHVNGATTGYHVIQSTVAGKPAAPGVTATATTEFGVYPNPATDKITIKFNSTTDGNASVKVVDISGKVIIDQVFSSAKGANAHEVELGNLASGIYILMFENGDDNEVRKISVQH